MKRAVDYKWTLKSELNGNEKMNWRWKEARVTKSGRDKVKYLNRIVKPLRRSISPP